MLSGPFWSCVLVCLPQKIASCANVTQHTTLWTVSTLKRYQVAAWCDVSALQTTQNICRPGVGRASAGRQYQTYLIPPADIVRASARRTTPGRCHDFWNSHNRCPADAPRRPMMTGRCKIGRPAGRLSEFLPLSFL